MELILEDSLQRGLWSVCYARLEDLVFDMAGEPPRVNLSANDLSPTLKRLDAMHLIRAEFGARAGWYVLVLPSSGWDVQWHRPASRRALRWMHLDGLRRAAAPFLPSFAPDADLYDALARAVPGASSAADDACEEKILASRRDFSSAQKADAPDVPPLAGLGACASRHSESRNAVLQGKSRCVPKIGTPSRARAAASSLKTKDSRLKINLKSWSDYSIEQKKSALIELEDCNSDDRVRALLNIILGDDVTYRDGGKWIKARWTQRAVVQRVMVLVVERLSQTHLERVRCTGRLAHSYAASCGVKFLTNIFLTQYKQGK
jgi:hypothetical protein